MKMYFHICAKPSHDAHFLGHQDVGFAILESYSRVLESLAYNVMSRIEDVIISDNVAREKAKKDMPPGSEPAPSPLQAPEDSMTLLDFMGWNGEAEGKVDDKSPSAVEQDDGRLMKLPNIMTNLKNTYMDVLGGHRSPPGRH
jgi:hypothetical protein